MPAVYFPVQLHNQHYRVPPNGLPDVTYGAPDVELAGAEGACVGRRGRPPRHRPAGHLLGRRARAPPTRTTATTGGSTSRAPVTAPSPRSGRQSTASYKRGQLRPSSSSSTRPPSAITFRPSPAIPSGRRRLQPRRLRRPRVPRSPTPPPEAAQSPGGARPHQRRGLLHGDRRRCGDSNYNPPARTVPTFSISDGRNVPDQSAGQHSASRWAPAIPTWPP